MTLSRPVRSLLLLVLSLVTFGAIGSFATAQVQVKPGRDPNQAIDQEYTNKIREYTTAPHFNSPLTDYLPASPEVPTPTAVLGDVAGAPGKLPYAEDVYKYMRMLERASPRVKVYSIGTTEEGREMIAVAVASRAPRAGAATRGSDCSQTPAARCAGTRPPGARTPARALRARRATRARAARRRRLRDAVR